MQDKKVSIILPTYNRENLLPNAIKSCLSQSYKNLELIIVNDGSTDNTEEIAQSFLTDSRVKYFVKTNEGLPIALNYGLDRTTGDYITWTSDDNLYKENAIEKLVEVLNEVRTPAFVYSNMSYTNDEGIVTSLFDSNCQNRIYMHNYIGGCFLYNYEVFRQVGYYDMNLRLVEDYDYWIRIYEKFPMYHLNEDIYLYKVHANSLSTTKALEVQKMFQLLYEKHKVYSKIMKDIVENCAYKNKRLYIWGTGSLAKRMHDHLDLKIHGFVEGINREMTSFLNKPVIFPEEIKHLKEDVFIIIASTYRTEIEVVLRRFGWEPNNHYY